MTGDGSPAEPSRRHASPGTHASSGTDRSISRRAALGSLAAAGLGGLAGCSSVVPSEFVPDTDDVTPAWRVDIDGASGTGLPAVVDDRLLVGAQDRALHGFDTGDGTERFAVETGGPIEARPAVPRRDGPHHGHSSDGDIYTVDADGERRWHQEGVPARGRLARAGPLLVEHDPSGETGFVRGFAAASGEVLFERPAATYRLGGLTPDLFATPVPERVPSGEGDGEPRGIQSPEDPQTDGTLVVAHDAADGSVRWRTTPTREHQAVVADRELVVTARGAELRAHGPADGSVRWRTTVDLEDGHRGATLGSQVYVAAETGESGIAALDRGSGEVRWRAEPGIDVRAVAPAPNAVFVGSRVDDPDGGILARVDCVELDGRRRWKTVTSIPGPERLLVVGTGVVVASGRNLVVLDRSDGSKLWHHDPNSSRVRVTATDSSLYAAYVDEGAVAELPVE